MAVDKAEAGHTGFLQEITEGLGGFVICSAYILLNLKSCFFNHILLNLKSCFFNHTDIVISGCFISLKDSDVFSF